MNRKFLHACEVSKSSMSGQREIMPCDIWINLDNVVFIEPNHSSGLIVAIDGSMNTTFKIDKIITESELYSMIRL
jgi:hypothetical protein